MHFNCVNALISQLLLYLRLNCIEYFLLDKNYSANIHDIKSNLQV